MAEYVHEIEFKTYLLIMCSSYTLKFFQIIVEKKITLVPNDAHLLIYNILL